MHCQQLILLVFLLVLGIDGEKQTLCEFDSCTGSVATEEFKFRNSKEALDAATNHMTTGRDDIAIAIAEKVLESDATNVDALRILGEVWTWKQGYETKGYEYLRRAMDASPEDPKVRFAVGNALLDSGDIDLAKEQFLFSARSVQSDQTLKYKSHLLLGQVWAYRQDSSDETDASRQRKALDEFQIAEDMNNHDSELYFHKGLALSQIGEIDKAMESYTRSIELNPEMAYSHANLATLYLQRNDFSSAYEEASLAIKLDPRNGDLYYNMGVIAEKDGDLNKAQKFWEDAVRIKPSCIPAHASLGNILQDKNLEGLATQEWGIAFDLANASNQKSLALALEVRARLRLDRSYLSLKHVSDLRARYDSSLSSLNERVSQEHLTINGIDAIGSMITDIGYYYVYLGYPNIRAREEQALLFQKLVPELLPSRDMISGVIHVQSKQPPDPPQKICFATPESATTLDAITCRCDSVIPNKPNVSKTWPALAQSSPTSKKMRIGFLSEFFFDHSVSKLIRNTIKLLHSRGEKENWQIVLFTFEHLARDEHVEDLFKHAHRVVSITTDHPTMIDNVLWARKMISQENLDILIFPEIGMAHLTYFIAHDRMAPTQIVFWGHPVTTGLKNSIDFFVSSKLFERRWDAVRDGRRYSEALWLMNGLSALFPQPPVAKFEDRISARLELLGKAYAKSHWYVCPQTAYKFHPLMDKVFVDILKRDSQAVLVFIQSKHPEWMDRVVERISKHNSLFRERIAVLPQMPIEEFLSLVGYAADVVLDTFPFGGGVSHFEALSVAAPVVVFEHKIPWTPQFAPGIYEYIFQGKLPKVDGINLVTTCPEEYVKNAVAIGNNPELRKSIQQVIREAVTSSGLFYNKNRQDNQELLWNDWRNLLVCSISRFSSN